MTNLTTTGVPASVLRAAAGGAAGRCSPLRSVSGSAWLVESGQGRRVVVRRSSPDEVRAARAAAEAGVGPQVLDVVDGWLVLAWLSGEPVSGVALRRPVILDAVADLLRRWHGCGVDLPAAPMRRARAEYAAGLELPPALRDMLLAADQVEASLADAALAPAHLDVAANLMSTDQGLRLIDFEYAAAAPPERELGQLVWEAELTPQQAERLVEAYYSGSPPPGALASVTAWTWVTGVTWTVWAERRSGLTTYRRRSWERLRRHWSLPAHLGV